MRNRGAYNNTGNRGGRGHRGNISVKGVIEGVEDAENGGGFSCARGAYTKRYG